MACCVSDAYGVYWNNDPAFGITSATGLTNRHDWFQNTHVINNASNSSRGTATLLNEEWAITVRHVVQNGGNYSQIAAPNNITLNVLGTTYVADQIFTPDGGSEMALVHLRGGVTGALDVTGQINTTFDEQNRFVEIGGYGYHGILNTTNVGGSVSGTASGSVNFFRAYNQISSIPSQIQIVANGEATLLNYGLLEGLGGPGDSGGPMFGYYGASLPPSSNPMDWRLIGLTATSNTSTSEASWGNSTNYTRIANYASWINSTLSSFPTPGSSTTQPWVQNSGTGFYDTGGDKITATGSSSASIAHTAFGPAGEGYTLNSVGDVLSFSAILDTPVTVNTVQFRYGMYDDLDGTVIGSIAGGTPWNGYFVGNATENSAQGVLEKGTNGGGTGAWWSLINPNSANPVGSSVAATGIFDDASGNQATPAARYAITLDYTRELGGLKIDWSMSSIDSLGVNNGVYSHSGSVLDTTPASGNWNYNKLGLMILGGSFTGTIVLDDIAVRFLDATVYAADFDGDGNVDSQDLAQWQLDYGISDGSDADGDGDSDGADFLMWQRQYGLGIETLSATVAVPEPNGIFLICVMLATSAVFRLR